MWYGHSDLHTLPRGCNAACVHARLHEPVLHMLHPDLDLSVSPITDTFAVAAQIVPFCTCAVCQAEASVSHATSKLAHAPQQALDGALCPYRILPRMSSPQTFCALPEWAHLVSPSSHRLTPCPQARTMPVFILGLCPPLENFAAWEWCCAGLCSDAHFGPTEHLLSQLLDQVTPSKYVHHVSALANPAPINLCRA